MNSIKKTMICLVILTGLCGAAFGDSGYGLSNVFTIDNRGGVSSLNGTVLEVDADGRSLGAIEGVTVSIAGNSDTSDSMGEFSFSDLSTGTYTLLAEKTGYYSSSKDITLEDGETKNEIIKLKAQAEDPTAYDIQSPDGKHIIEGIPIDLSFAAMIAWNGSSGQVYFNFNGICHPADVVDLGGGLAQATLTISAPSSVSSCHEMIIEVINGEGDKTEINAGVHFYSMPGIIVPWYKDDIPWTADGLSLSYSLEKKWVLWKAEIPSGVYSSEASVGFNNKLKYDLLAGTFSGTIGGFGEFEQTLEYSGVENFGKGRLDLTGSLDIGLAGCNPPTITPSWKVTIGGKAGLRAPAVTAVIIIFPQASPTLDKMLKVPILKDILKILKLELALFGDLSLAGNYKNGWGEGFLGTTSLDMSGTLGIEGKAYLELWGAKAGIYTGGSGSPEFQIQPDWKFNGLTLRAWVGIFGSAWLFELKEEIATEIRFEPSSGKMNVINAVSLPGDEPTISWQPIGQDCKKWGEVNYLVKKLSEINSLSNKEQPSEEEVLVENVTQLAGPSISSDSSETTVLYSLNDPNKPWYAANDITAIRRENTNPWSMARVTDDLASEFSPEIIGVDSVSKLAAWERIDGDISGAESPDDVAPYLEIVASWYDRSSDSWSVPEQITFNSEVDHNPLPVSYGENQGVFWVHNDANDVIGNLVNGDDLMFSEWTGAGWASPRTLWSANKGILGYSFTDDGTDEGWLVFAVDEDGDNETREDRELYMVSTVSEIWQEAVRLTNDAVEDSIPVFVAPNGNPMCVWNSGGTMMYSCVSSWNPQILFSEYTIANEAASLEGQTMPGGAAVAYTAQTEDGVDIVASFYDAILDVWSLPRQLTFDDHVESSLSLNCESSELVIAYLKTQTERNDIDIEIEGEVYHLENVPQPGRTDIYALRHQLGNDLAVTDDPNLVIPLNPAPGSSAVLTAVIENRGDLPVENIEVAFYLGDPQSNGVQIGETQVLTGLLPAGAKGAVTVNWELTYEPGSRDIYIVVDPTLAVEDRDRLNNSILKTVTLPDLTIQSCWSEELGPDQVILTARIDNSGVLSTSGFEISWRLGSVEGEEIGRSAIQQLKVNETYETTFNWTITGYVFKDQPVMVYAVADCNEVIAEFDESNNSQGLIVSHSQATLSGDIVIDGIIDILDLNVLAEQWLGSPMEPSADIAPQPYGDSVVNLLDFAMLAEHWLEEVKN